MAEVDNIFDSMIDDVNYLKKLVVIRCRLDVLNNEYQVSKEELYNL